MAAFSLICNLADKIIVARGNAIKKPILILSIKEEEEEKDSNIVKLIQNINNFLGKETKCDLPLLILMNYQNVEVDQIVLFIKKYFTK